VRLPAARILVLLALAGWPLFSDAAPAPATAPVGAPAPGIGDGDLVIRAGRLFDGYRMSGPVAVRVRNGRIAEVGRRLRSREGDRVIDCADCTLLPGLIDAHVHYLEPRNLRQALVFGVTTEFDMGTDPLLAARAKERQKKDVATEADIRSAGALLTAPAGHGTEYGLRISTIRSPAEADALVRERIASGSDYIKIILDSGRTFQPLPTISTATLRALVEAAHAHGRMAIVHVGSSAEASAALAAGADGLAHLFVDAPPAKDLAASARRNHAFVEPTLVVMEKIVGPLRRKALLTDKRLRPYLAPSDVAELQRSFPIRATVPTSMAFAASAIARLKRAGVPLLAGSDSGRVHGPLLLREIELLSRHGLSRIEALRAATSAPAGAFGLDDRGALATGKRADLLLVRGDPSRDLASLRDIRAVIKQGWVVDRQAFAESMKSERAADDALRRAPPPLGLGDGLVSDFEEGKLSSRWGSGWSASTDAIAGGTSTVSLELPAGGAGAGGHALRVAGEIRPGFPFGFAGALFSPGTKPFAPANLAGRRISFDARGDGGTYAVMISARSYGRVPVKAPFAASRRWRHYSFALDSFDGMDGHDIGAIMFSAGPRLGPFEFQIDNVRLEPAARSRRGARGR
jgi:imidazolonepropionase-like amidohydrolase